jgi:hypothetical protein
MRVINGYDIGPRADLTGANLTRADLSWADLSWADLSWADLTGANLDGANLSGVNLDRANLSGVNLDRANLSGVNLTGANLRWAKDVPPQVVELTAVVPAEGEVTGWKKCRDGVIVKLLIPAEAQRSNATTRKCRASSARVLEVIGDDEATSLWDVTFKYRAGETVSVPEFDENRWAECSAGIHFFLTREEAEAWREV